MFLASERRARGWSLTQRLAVALSIGGLFVAVVLGFLGADRDDRRLEQARAASELSLAIATAERAAPLLERGDIMRLAVLGATVHDQSGGRAIILDRTGNVLLDTALVLGERQLALLAASGPFQRNDIRDGRIAVRESVAPVRFGGEVIGEIRLQHEVRVFVTTFDVTWFGLVLLSCLSLVSVAVMLGHHWSTRVRGATDALIRVGAGEASGVTEARESELQELGLALQEVERGVQDGLARVAAGYVSIAQQVVDGLERNRLVPLDHGERTARYAAQLAERLQLLPGDKKDLELACRFVDLGKAWVRPSILQKRTELTDVETRSLHHHPVLAAEQLDSMPGLRRAGRIIRHQLERYDGAGLPDALRGDRIPLGARMLAIASAFDLLTCAGESPLHWQDALLHLGKERGAVFDPWLLDLFAEEIAKDPPDPDPDPNVMIVPGGTVPWRTLSSDEEVVDEAEPEQLEVLIDENMREEPQ
ncbi:MAG TPA: HD domain-containing phosphohydrolase [Planctomycetota bacterium]